MLWGGRFSEELNDLAARLNNSITFDWQLAEVDVRGSQAWAKALQKAGVISAEEVLQIDAGLSAVLQEVTSGQFTLLPSDEDVHTAVERRLTELIGSAGGRLHTGRSRNDQVATDFRLWLLGALDMLDSLLTSAQAALVDRAEKDMGIILPGYTHFQRAQPVLLSHWWLSHFWPLHRDRERLRQVRARTAVLPLGSGALAGVSFPVDRSFLAEELGFQSVSANSLDAVSDRDFALEFLFLAALIGVHLSRLSEALILYSTAEYHFLELSDTYSTGSSLMPQKKNPDTLELVRGKAGSLIGWLTGLFATLKGLPSAYDKDLQEDKVPVFEAVRLLRLMLPVMTGLLSTLTIHREYIRKALDPALLATDLADYLVHRGVPFRDAHHLVGKAVLRAQAAGLPLSQLPLSEFQAISPLFSSDVYQVFDFQASVDRHNAAGGTSTRAVMLQLEQAKANL